MPIHPWLGVAQVQPQPQVPPLVHLQLVVQPQPQEQASTGTAGWVMGVEQVQVMVFLLLVVDGGSGSAASVNQASTLQWRGKSKGGRAVYRAELQKGDRLLPKSLPPFHRHELAGAGQDIRTTQELLVGGAQHSGPSVAGRTGGSRTREPEL